ncbi:mechanosensitive ion channel domain-containing protein [Fusobacterium sp. THCT13E1]
MLFFKPFLKGEYIKTSLRDGTVDCVHILYSVLTTPDNSKIIIPNSQLVNSAVTNISRNPEILHNMGYTIRMKKHNSSSLALYIFP